MLCHGAQVHSDLLIKCILNTPLELGSGTNPLFLWKNFYINKGKPDASDLPRWDPKIHHRNSSILYTYLYKKFNIFYVVSF